MPRGVLDPSRIQLDWTHIYLLGWYDDNGKPHLTTWEDNERTRESYVHVVVTGPGVREWGPPMWNAPATVKPNNLGIPSIPIDKFNLHPVKPNEDWERKAQQLGGIRAFGWYIAEGFERRWE